IWTIAWNDTVIRLRDRNALLLTLLAPMLITAIMGLALSGGGAESRSISIVVINQDEGQFGKIFEAALAGANSGLAFKSSSPEGMAGARETVDRGAAQALIYVPRNFSAALQSAGGAGAAAPDVQVYCGVDAAAKADAIRSVCDQAARRLRALIVGKQLAAARLQ